MEKQIKQSQNFVQVVGTLAEMNLEITEKETKLRNFTSGKEKTVTCKVIGKKDFRNPTLLIDVAPTDEETGEVIYTASIGVNMNEVAEIEIDEHGAEKENPQFKAMQTIMSEYITKKDAKEGELPTRVMVKSARLTPNEYVDKNDFSYKVYLPNITTYNVTSSGVPENDIAEGNISGIIRRLIKETRGEEAEETGRLKVELYTFDKQGRTTPVTLIAEADLAESIEDTYEAGDNVQFFFEVISKQVGGAKKVVESGFGGRRKPKTVSGFTVTEYSIFDGSPKFEEDNQYYVSVEDMKEAMKERDILIETKIKDMKEKTKDGKKSKDKTSTTGTARGGLGGRTAKAVAPKEEEQEVKDLF